MTVTNLQTFSGEVEIPDGNLQLKKILELSANNSSTSNTGILISRNLGATSNSNVIVYFDEATESLRVAHTLNAASDSELIMDAANVLVMNVFGDVEASFFKGDGGLLSNIVTDLQSVSEGGSSTDRTVVLSNVTTGVEISSNAVVTGNLTAGIFFGDGGLLSNITQTLQGITEIGNTTTQTLEFNNVTTGFVTTANVGIVNTNPNYNFSVGSNLHVHDTGINGNTLSVTGNMYVSSRITLGSVEILPGYGLENVTNISNLAHSTLQFSNATTAFVTTAKAGIGIEPDASDVGVAGLHVDGHLRLGGPAGTDENSDIYLRSAGQLNIESNDTDTDNQYTALALRAGNLNESNIIVEGALSDTTKQYISFATRNTERMKIDREGNVTVGYDSTSHKLDVAGTANVSTLHAANLVINTVSVSVLYGLDEILENGNTTSNSMTVGGIEISGASGELFRYTDGTRTVYGGCDVNEPWFGTSSDDDLRLVTNSIERVRLSNVGQVGIGWNAPEYTLDVRGGSVNYKERWMTDITLPVGLTRYPVSNVITNSAALTAGNWYRVALNGSATDGATGGSRASARFTITDGQPSYHAQRSFYAGNTFGGYPFIHLLYNTGYSNLGSISQVRIVEDQDYEGVAIDIYAVQNTPIGAVHVIIDDNYATAGFALQPFTSVAADISGMNEMVLNLNETSWSIFNDSNTYNMCMDFSGNVGIGTRNPAKSLHIYRGQSYVSGGTSNNSAFEIIQQLGTDDYSNYGQHRAQFRIANGLGTYGSRSLELALLDNGTGVIQANASNEGYSPLLMNPGGGNVAIGALSPSGTYKFTVSGNMEVGTHAGDYRHLRIGGGNSNGFLYGAYAAYGDGIHLGYNYYHDNTNPVIPNTGGATSRISCGYGYVALYTGGTNAAPVNLGLFQDQSGLVGIGVNPPTHKLDVNGTLRVRGASTYLDWNDNRIIMTYDNSYRQGISFDSGNRVMRLFSTSNDAGGAIAFHTRFGLGASDTDYGTEKMRISAEGNVGIGYSTPYAPLVVASTRNAETWSPGSTKLSVVHNNGTSVYGMSFSVSALYGDGVIQTYNASAAVAQYNLRLQPNGGNVGIGTTSAAQKFHVHVPGIAWPDFTIRGTSLWGDGLTVANEYNGTQYATLYGAMFQNLHVVPSTTGGNAHIRMGRAGGIQTGNYWEVACRTDGSFHIANNSNPATGGGTFFVNGGANIRSARTRAARTNDFDYTTTASGGQTNVRVPYDYASGEVLWNNTHERYTAPYAGEYVIGGSFMCTPVNSQYIWAQIWRYNSAGTFINGGAYLGMFTPTNGAYNTVHFYYTTDLAAGDYIEVRYYVQALAGQVAAVNLHGSWGEISVHCIRRY